MAKKSQTKEMSTNAVAALASESGESSDKIERIRDLILGPQTRDIAQRFSALSKDISRLEGELSQVSEELRTQGKQLQTSINEAEKRLTAQIKETATGSEERIVEVDGRISERVGELEKHITGRLQTIVQDLRELEQTGRSELRETFDEMNQAKMDRFSLGELFSQLGDGLKSSKPEDEITSLLNELQQEIG